MSHIIKTYRQALLVIGLLISGLISGQDSIYKNEMDSISQISMIEMEQSRYENSLKHIEELRKRANELNDPYYQAMAADMMVGISIELGDFEMAEEYSLKAIEINKENDNYSRLAVNYSNISHYNLLIGNIDNVNSSQRMARYYDSISGYKSRYFIDEREALKLFMTNKHDSVIIVCKGALKDLSKTKVDQLPIAYYKDVNLKSVIHQRVKTNLELYLAYSLMEQGKQVEKANSLLNKYNSKDLEKILWLNHKVYEHYYNINQYKAQYFYLHNTKHTDSADYYQRLSNKDFHNTTKYLKEKFLVNNDHLTQALNNENKLTRLQLDTKILQQENLFVNKINILFGVLGALGLFFIIYLVRTNTIEKTSNAELDVTNRSLLSMIETRKKLLAVVSHEVRTPLYAMQELVANASDEAINIKNKELHLIHYSLFNLKHAMDNSLQFSRLNFLDSKIVFNNKETDIDRILFGLLTEFKSVTVINEVELTSKIDTLNHIFELPINKLLILLRNLIKNAVEKNDANKVILRVSEKNISNKSSILRFNVIDNGSATTQEAMDYVENGKFSLSKKNLANKLRFGLILCNQLLAFIDSRLIFKATNGNNQVYFDIKAKPIKTTSTKTLAKIKSTKILYVDDDLINLLVTKKIIESLGHTCDTVNNGYAALIKVKEKKYNIVLMDLNMPEIDGYETSKAIKQINDEIPIIAYTALSEDSVYEKCKEAQILEILTKPLNTYEFEKLIIKYAYA